MDIVTKIILSPADLSFMQDKSVIDSRNRINEAIAQMLSDLSIEIGSLVKEYEPGLPAGIGKGLPKISRGENYRGYPYILLDYPAHFHKSGSLAIRNMFWWGSFFSVTLHVSGNYKLALQETIARNVSRNKGKWRLCVGDDEWEHHMGEENYSLPGNFSEEELYNQISAKPFLKLALEIPLDIPGVIMTKLIKANKEILGLLKD